MDIIFALFWGGYLFKEEDNFFEKISSMISVSIFIAIMFFLSGINVCNNYDLQFYFFTTFIGGILEYFYPIFNKYRIK